MRGPVETKEATESWIDRRMTGRMEVIQANATLMRAFGTVTLVTYRLWCLVLSKQPPPL